MTQSILMNLDKVEFKAFIREALTEVLNEAGLDSTQNRNDLFTIKEAAAFLKVKITTLYEKTSSKLIPHIKRGNKLYFYRADLETWLREGKVKTQKELQGEAATYTMLKQKKAA